MAGRRQVLVLAVVGFLRGIARLTQFLLDALALDDLLQQVAVDLLQLGGAGLDSQLQLIIEQLQALLRQLTLGDVGDEPLDETILTRLEQQVHQYIDGTAILAS
ncbi:hypothetical protein D3C80_1567930 [compost metagenome]